ncbi:FecR family protein [Maribellus maritimus]|uniref:FecR family protein n=1 Tax=Maribellus maritimus TaxID=2870838 RepID=UPI001EEAF871|nr:FecR family protein [Maribellus maritimus]MCG6189171.1 FecR family protein [Maribellus maritimus]
MNKSEIEEILPLYFDGNLSEKDKLKVEVWKESSDKNQKIFKESEKAWQGITLLQTMKKYDSEKALQQVNAKIERQNKNILTIIQKIAAILILPLIISTLYFALKKQDISAVKDDRLFTVTSPAGMRSEYILPDGTKVYLNSKTSLSFPATFSGNLRNVTLHGEAYFEVAENKKKPFIVNTGKINIEVTGTQFKASNYSNENLTEIVLVSGSINLFSGKYGKSKENIIRLKPGEKANYIVSQDRISIENVDVDKYISWKDGILMFRNDPMPQVVKRLNHWFNVDIKLTGNDLTDYVYTGTFEDESLNQILDLLKISAPIEYKIIKRHKKNDQTFSKMEIEIIQK